MVVIVFLLYADMAYCKYVCPLGRVITTHGKLGGRQLKANRTIAKACKDFSCARFARIIYLHLILKKKITIRKAVPCA